MINPQTLTLRLQRQHPGTAFRLGVISWLPALLISVLLLLPGSTQAAMIHFNFDQWEGPPIRVFVTRPVNLAPDRPVVFVMHGTRRNARDYRYQWHELALEHDFMLVVPEFRRDDFAGAEGYNMGNVFQPDGSATDEKKRGFAVIEPLFDEIRQRYGMQTEKYAIYGHSAGAQFVHRFVFHTPEARINKAIAANAGWYMMPDLDVAYPYGFEESLLGRRQLEQAFQIPLTILLGEEDTDPDHPSLRRAAPAMAQGDHRFARGETFMETARNTAAELDVALNWNLETVAGADHDNQLMAPVAAELLAPIDQVDQSGKSRRNPRPPSEFVDLRLLSFNIWGGGLNEGRSIDDTLNVLREVDADIIGLQEVRAEDPDCTSIHCNPVGESVTSQLAEALGYYHYELKPANAANWSNAVLSRFPIGETTDNGLGVVVDVNGTDVFVFNVHLAHFPYQPYQLLGIEYGGAPVLNNADEAEDAALLTRQAGLDLLLSDVRSIPWNAHAVIFGDLNEPSHHDWTWSTEAEGIHPMRVRWPTARNIEKRGFVDAFRRVHPDSLARPGFTWTPKTYPDDPQDHHDRIDYVFVRKRGVDILINDAQVVGELGPMTDLAVSPWPSDHRAVMADIAIETR